MKRVPQESSALEAALIKALQLDSSQILKVSPRQPIRHPSAGHRLLHSWIA